MYIYVNTYIYIYIYIYILFSNISKTKFFIKLWWKNLVLILLNKKYINVFWPLIYTLTFMGRGFKIDGRWNQISCAQVHELKKGHWLFQKKSKQRFIWGHRYILETPLEFIGLSLYLWIFWKKQSFSPGNSAKLCYMLWNFQRQKPRPMKISHFPWLPQDIPLLFWTSACYFFNCRRKSVSSLTLSSPLFGFFQE